jgi:hypothetical protein
MFSNRRILFSVLQQHLVTLLTLSYIIGYSSIWYSLLTLSYIIGYSSIWYILLKLSYIIRYCYIISIALKFFNVFDHKVSKKKEKRKRDTQLFFRIGLWVFIVTSTKLDIHICYFTKFQLFKDYLKLLNRLYDITWFWSVYA